ncbi:MAG: glycerate kinase [Candidatus Eremiobacteraeota bacterium]|nr:glycerate kinase [Candidatus Eremiobacteraeota bacterium]
MRTNPIACRLHRRRAARDGRARGSPAYFAAERYPLIALRNRSSRSLRQAPREQHARSCRECDFGRAAKPSSSVPRIVIAPDKFKGSLTAAQAAQAIERGIRRADPAAECVQCPMADGGEGTVEAFLERGAERRTARVAGPLGAATDAVYALRNGTAILEMAAASGLGLLARSAYDPTRADTSGTGQLISAALDERATHLIIGIGGSATNDAGTGMLRALGGRFLDRTGVPIEGPIFAFEDLASIDCSELDARPSNVRIEVAVDVDNPLCGPSGASYTFAEQKGAGADQIQRLDAVLRHIADVSAAALGRDYRDAKGAGAAGGLGFALAAFLGAKLEPGVQLIARECGLDELLSGAIWCITGEGKIDAQTLHGKTVAGVAEIAAKHNVPTIAFCGVAEPDAVEALQARGVRVIAITPEGMPLADALKSGAQLLESAAAAAPIMQTRPA